MLLPHVIRKREEYLLDPKIREAFSLGNSIQGLRKRNAAVKIGFTNGTFKILTPAHCVFLSLCKSKCDILVVAVNSDASLRSLKKDSFFSVQERVFAVASLCCSDYVTIFDEETPHLCISKVNPDIIFKGGEYKAEDVVCSGKPVEIINHPFKVHTSDILKSKNPKNPENLSEFKYFKL